VRIERHPSVIEDDLPGIYAHIARDNPAAAERVLDAVAKTFDDLAAQPEMGVLYSTRNPQMKALRMLPVSGFHNFLVFYRIEGDAVRILYVVHGARHLRRLLARDRRA
jgi:toxin ParE1/3/4